MEFTIAHTQNSVTVYTTHREKEDIREAAKSLGKSMSQYMLDLHKENKKSCPCSSVE